MLLGKGLFTGRPGPRPITGRGTAETTAQPIARSMTADDQLRRWPPPPVTHVAHQTRN